MDQLKVFISYSHKDKDIAAKFFDFLSDLDFDVIVDEHLIVVGDDFTEKFTLAISQSDIFIPIVTHNYDISKFANMQLLTAKGYNISKGSPRICPYIANGHAIPYDLLTISCFMGTDNLDDDLKKMKAQLISIRTSILTDRDTNIQNETVLHTSLETYLQDVFSTLEKKEKLNRRLAYCSYAASIVFLGVMVIMGVWNISKQPINTTADIPSQVFLSLDKTLTLTVLAALSRLSFILGKSFMVEAIRNGDRIHAISFGKFYIQAYGKEASRQEIREVLGDWNIDKGSSFQTQDAKDIDPNVLGIIDALKSQKNNT